MRCSIKIKRVQKPWIYWLEPMSAKSFIYQPPIMLFRRESSHIGESSHLLLDLAKTSRHHCTPCISLFLPHSNILALFLKATPKVILLLREIFKLIVRISYLYANWHINWISDSSPVCNSPINSKRRTCVHPKFPISPIHPFLKLAYLHCNFNEYMFHLNQINVYVDLSKSYSLG